jgi:hypothetical protein
MGVLGRYNKKKILKRRKNTVKKERMAWSLGEQFRTTDMSYPAYTITFVQRIFSAQDKF